MSYQRPLDEREIKANRRKELELLAATMAAGSFPHGLGFSSDAAPKIVVGMFHAILQEMERHEANESA